MSWLKQKIAKKVVKHQLKKKGFDDVIDVDKLVKKLK